MQHFSKVDVSIYPQCQATTAHDLDTWHILSVGMVLVCQVTHEPGVLKRKLAAMVSDAASEPEADGEHAKSKMQKTEPQDIM